MNSLADMPPYTMSMAFSDVNVWIVIFCGFITYMIWGIVLDMVITAYSDFRSNAGAIEKIKNEINKLQIRLNNLKNRESGLKNQKSKVEGEIRVLESSLQKTKIPISVITEAISDFFAGWTAVVSVLQPRDYDFDKAKEHYNNCINSITTNSSQI